MRPRRLPRPGASAWAAAAVATTLGATHAAPACAPPGAPLIERFVDAHCTACWSASGETAGAGWRLDWIVPGATGDEAPMSAAAVPEAADRVRRSGAPPPAASQSVVRRTALTAAAAPRLEVQIGPAWHGYLALTLKVSGHAPAGATGWLALVEELPAGAEGSPIARELVRTVAGPLPLAALAPGRPLTHLRALRWPETARPERLRARGWVESTGGRVLRFASSECPEQRR